MSLRTSRDRRSGYATFGMNSKPNAGLHFDSSGNPSILGPAGESVLSSSSGAATIATLISNNFTFQKVARTATAAGTTTGTIADAGLLQFVTVTSDDVNKIIILPTPTPGTIVILANGATGYELRTSSPTTIGINGGTGANAESAIPANTLVVMICETATSWKGLQLGSDGTLAKVEVAA